MSRKKLFLIDGNSFCYRAFYAIKSLSNSKGFPTNAVYGFISMLNKIISSEHPDYLCVAFDLKGPTFRHKKFAEYKIHRKPMPEELVMQMPVIKRALRAYRVSIYEKQGFEADDIIGTISAKAAEDNIETYIVTGDKDALQLMSSHIKIYSTNKDGLIYDELYVKNRYGIGPDGVVDLLSLMGDASDNIPGIPGIGEKTAVNLLKKFKDLDTLAKNIDSIESEYQRKIVRENIESAFISKELATIDRSVDININFDDMKLTEPDKEGLIELFKELEFSKLLKDLVGSKGLTGRYSIVRAKKEFDNLISKLKDNKEWAFDFETTGTDPMVCDVVGASFCWKKEEAVYISFIEKDGAFTDREYMLSMLKPLFEDSNIKKVGQNIKYEKVILRCLGIRLAGISFDTMVASYLLNPSKFNHNLSDIVFEYIGCGMQNAQDMLGKGSKKITMAEVPLADISMYCCKDSDAAFRLKSVLEKKLKEKDLYRLFCDIELPLIDVLADIEYSGVKLDISLLRETSEYMARQIEQLQYEIYGLVGEEFNINSPKQLASILFERCKLPVVKRTKTGFSTDVDVLTKLSEQHPVPAKILEYREFSKLKSTYADALPKLINTKTGKVHTSFNQTVTATGRLSSSDPNLQNIPIKTESGRRIRKAFISSFKEGLIVSADYSQIELMLLAHISGDEELLNAFKDNKDVHTRTASLIFNCEEEAVTEKMRQQAKIVNFGIVYGMSPYGLSKELGIGVDEAKNFIDSYFSRYPNVNKYITQQISFARDKGYVLTMLNRRRYIPEINSSNQSIRMFAERMAINTPIQGTAADIIKLAMIKIHSDIEKKMLKSMMIMQVHDELVFDLPSSEKDELIQLVKEDMEGVIKLKIPVKVNIDIGKSWLE